MVVVLQYRAVFPAGVGPPLCARMEASTQIKLQMTDAAIQVPGATGTSI